MTFAPPPAAWPASWLVPDWPAPPRVRAVCTTREGGVSQGPYASLNLGDHVGDEPEAVRANRAWLQARLGAEPRFLRQVHGCRVADWTEGLAPAAVPEADGCIATAPGQACAMMVADCMPVLFTDRAGSAVAAAHAGWRGLAGGPGHPGGILAAVLARFRTLVRSQPASVATEVIAWLGPCIGPARFEVGEDVRSAFLYADPEAGVCFQPQAVPGKWLADLPALARRRLAALGVRGVWGNDGSEAWCTVAQASRFFSHRRDSRLLGGSGRFAACIWLQD